ncbi:hypothetical protein IKC_04209 [Bacillus cereus VD184]|uniref:Uncharacterized protein n=1 Tax=Bacillus cereus VD184 TaxID=1053242 RepID=A0A9W5RBW7_BACCE|nr:hypothetical protein IKC_04209 [Bacillus cereus VD184]
MNAPDTMAQTNDEEKNELDRLLDETIEAGKKA